MSESRYCQTCSCNTLHDKKTINGQTGEVTPLVERFLHSIFTLGILEAIENKVWECQKCNTITGR